MGAFAKPRHVHHALRIRRRFPHRGQNFRQLFLFFEGAKFFRFLRRNRYAFHLIFLHLFHVSSIGQKKQAYSIFLQIVKEFSLYTCPMNGFSTQNLLLGLPFQGCIWLVALFFAFFIGAHVVKLAKEGWQTRRKQEKQVEPSPTETKKETPNPSPSQEPVYYIVEKKRRRPKRDYGEPKPIRFQ